MSTFMRKYIYDITGAGAAAGWLPAALPDTGAGMVSGTVIVLDGRRAVNGELASLFAWACWSRGC